MHSSRSTLFAVVASLAATVQSRLVLFYPLNETSGQQARDYSGNNLHASYVGGPQLQGVNGARLDGVDDYIRLPNDLMRNLYTVTVSIDVLIRPEQRSNYFIFGIGNTGNNGYGNGYVFATGDPYRAAISPANYDSEAEVRTGSNLPRNVWKTVTFVVDSRAGQISLYQDGAYVGGRTNNDPIVAPGSIGTGSTQANYIGRSTFTRDPYLAGSVRNFRLWDTALSANEVASVGAVAPVVPQPPGIPGSGSQSPADRVTAALLSLTIPNIDDVRGNLALASSWNGIPVSWSSSRPEIISNTGVVNRPANGDVQVTLIATLTYEGVRGERPFIATVRRAGT